MNNSARNLLIKKLLYRSKQRGWLEVDLILGSWASKNLKNLSNNDLLKYENFLNEDTVNIYNYLTKTKELNSNIDKMLVNRIIEDSKKEINTPLKYSNIKKFMSN